MLRRIWGRRLRGEAAEQPPVIKVAGVTFEQGGGPVAVGQADEGEEARAAPVSLTTDFTVVAPDGERRCFGVFGFSVI